MSLEPGRQLGPYAVTAKIGEGGMGLPVVLARDASPLVNVISYYRTPAQPAVPIPERFDHFRSRPTATYSDRVGVSGCGGESLRGGGHEAREFLDPVLTDDSCSSLKSW